jgi:hypothetical protein
MTRVQGELKPALEVAGLEATYAPTWNPLRPGAARVAFTLVNKGNARLKVTGTTECGGQLAPFPADGDPGIELLPGGSHRVELTINGVWPLFRLKTVVTADPSVLAVDGTEAPAIERVVARTTSWAVPWPQLACLVGLALVLAAALTGHRQSTRKTASQIARARAEGAAEALAARQGES